MENRATFVLLMVDDDQDDCLLVRDAVEESRSCGEPRIDLRFLHDGVELLEYLKDSETGPPARSPRPDLILLDLNMPRMDGGEALAEIKSSIGFRSIPVVVFTTSGGTATVQQCYNYGANSFIQKPAGFRSLAGIIRSLLDYWVCTTQAANGC